MHIQYFVAHDQEGQYITIPFTMPPNLESFTLSYSYERRHAGGTSDGFTSHPKVNTIDLGLVAPDGSQVGASGSDKSKIEISETVATPGYRSCHLVPGEWRILLGAYKVAPEGVDVAYELTFTPKHPRWFKGDLHAHTLASDGVQTVGELAQRAMRHGLQFLAITDHNQMISSDLLPHVPGVTLIPGIEWTHFKGHANFLGVDKPYDQPFFTNDAREVKTRFDSARERGAVIVINHPFEEECPFQFDIHSLPFDCLEVWNGPMRESNLRAIGLWQNLLAAGKKIPICGGSDYHRDQLFIYPGGPTTNVYALSASPADLLVALKAGHAYIAYGPDAPTLEMTAGEAIMGDSVAHSKVKQLRIKATGLKAGDVLQVITAKGGTHLIAAETYGAFDGSYTMETPGFARVEIGRSFIPGLPLLPALISNPIYFDG